MTHDYAKVEPSRSQVDALEGPVVIEFGTPWCGFCKAAQPLLESALVDHPEMAHIKIEDGKGRPLGRSFRVTLWPTLIFLQDGKEVSRLVRPQSVSELIKALAQLG